MELRREFEKLKREKEDELRRKEQEKLEELKKKSEEDVLRSNPLLSEQLVGEEFSLKKKWYEETVFRNQALKEKEKKEKTFVNDTVRSDFHRKFMAKYI